MITEQLSEAAVRRWFKQREWRRCPDGARLSLTACRKQQARARGGRYEEASGREDLSTPEVVSVPGEAYRDPGRGYRYFQCGRCRHSGLKWRPSAHTIKLFSMVPDAGDPEAVGGAPGF